jgi:hypothetical protein
MDANISKRKTSIYCPKCGHLEVKARTCDIEMKCRRCHYQFEAVIRPSADAVADEGEGAFDGRDVPNANQVSRSKSNNQIHPDS